MSSPKLTSCLLFLCLLFTGYEGVKGSLSDRSSGKHRRNGDLLGFQPRALFVFGDSYVDAGNLPRDIAESWKFPYGISLPGFPTGRASDGLVSSDFLAHSFGLRSPVPYEQRNSTQEPLRYGMNFAYGGAGVFETMFQVPNTTLQINNFERVLDEGVYSPEDLSSSAALFSIAGNDYFTFNSGNGTQEVPNTTLQINNFERVLDEGVYSPEDLSSSAALFSIAGNDYFTFNSGNGTQEDLLEFIIRVARQIILDVVRIRKLGVRKVVVPALPPLGCLPLSTADGGFQQCNDTINLAAVFHNALRNQTLTELNNEANDNTFVMLDIYHALLTILENKGIPEILSLPSGGTRLIPPIKPGGPSIIASYAVSLP